MQKYMNLSFIKVTLLMLKKQQKSIEKTYQFKTQCKGDISHAFETAKIIVFDPVVCKLQMRPYKTSCWAEHLYS